LTACPRLRDHPPIVVSPRERALFALLVLNLTLQGVDGVATYLGLGLGFGEGNPLLASAMGTLGTAPALVLFKLEACACLLVVWRLRRSWLAGPALGLAAVLYATCAVGPWAVALAWVHLPPYWLS
jgi:uncharacterized membrane protein